MRHLYPPSGCEADGRPCRALPQPTELNLRCNSCSGPTRCYPHLEVARQVGGHVARAAAQLRQGLRGNGEALLHADVPMRAAGRKGSAVLGQRTRLCSAESAHTPGQQSRMPCCQSARRGWHSILTSIIQDDIKEPWGPCHAPPPPALWINTLLSALSLPHIRTKLTGYFLAARPHLQIQQFNA